MAIKDLQSIIQNSGNQQTGGSDISMEEFARRNRESAEAAIDEYEKWNEWYNKMDLPYWEEQQKRRK